MSFKEWGCGFHHLLVEKEVDVSISGNRENSELVEWCLLSTQHPCQPQRYPCPHITGAPGNESS